MTVPSQQETGLRRVVAAFAIFAGWVSIPVGAIAGIVVSESFGISHTEGPIAPADVYGINGLIVMWILVGAAIITTMPLLMAMFAPNPRRNLLVVAAALGIPALAVLPSELGRAFGLPIVAGAAALIFAARLLNGELPATAASGEDDSATVTPDGTPARADPASTDPTPAPTPTPAPVGASAPPRRSRRKKAKTSASCPWCSADVAAGAETCPSCGATIDSGRSADSVSIAGLTEVAPGLRDYEARSARKKPSILKMMLGDDSVPLATDVPEPSDQAAILPPSAELRAEMARLDAEIATGKAIFGTDATTEATDATDATADSATKPEA